MISEKNYQRMATEVLEIISLYPNNIKEKLPKKLIDKLEKDRLPNLKVKLDKTKKLYEQDVCDETLVLVYMIYRDYIAGPDEKKYFDNILKSFDEETKKQYDPVNLFENNAETKIEKNDFRQDR